MYNPGDYAVVSRYGVCRIDSVGHPSLPCADPSVDYYTLRPLREDCVIHIPCSISSEHLRPVITEDQALDLIKSIPAIRIRKVKDRQRTQRYKEAVDSGNPAMLLPVIMEIWQLNEDTVRKGRPISRITEATIFREAEMIFNCEIGHALGCSAADVPGVIRRMVKTAAAAQDTVSYQLQLL